VRWGALLASIGKFRFALLGLYGWPKITRDRSAVGVGCQRADVLRLVLGKGFVVPGGLGIVTGVICSASRPRLDDGKLLLTAFAHMIGCVLIVPLLLFAVAVLASLPSGPARDESWTLVVARNLKTSGI